jgi:hypothetical protein
MRSALKSQQEDAMSVHFLGALRDPRELVEHPRLEPEVKRAILASWASDAFAVRSHPTLRKPPELPSPVPVQDVFAALKRIDGAGPSAA